MDNNINNINGMDTNPIVTTPVATVDTSTTTATPTNTTLPPVSALDTGKSDTTQPPADSKVRLIVLIVTLILLAILAGATYMYQDKISDLFTSSSRESETTIEVNANVDVNKDTSDKSILTTGKTVAIVEMQATNTVSVISTATTSIATSSPIMSTATKSTSTIVKGYTASIIIKHAKATVTINDEVFVDKDSSDTFTSISGGLTNLNKGNNKVVVTYTKSADGDTDMAVIMEVKRYSKLVLTLSPKNNSKQGTLEGNILVP